MNATEFWVKALEQDGWVKCMYTYENLSLGLSIWRVNTFPFYFNAYGGAGPHIPFWSRWRIRKLAERAVIREISKKFKHD